jgi:hypothetical protein
MFLASPSPRHCNTRCSQPRHVQTICTRISKRCAHPRPCRYTYAQPTPNGYWVWHPRPSPSPRHCNTHCSRLAPPGYLHSQYLNDGRFASSPLPADIGCGTLALAPRTDTQNTIILAMTYTKTLTATKVPTCIYCRCMSVSAHPLGRCSLSFSPNTAPALASECVRWREHEVHKFGYRAPPQETRDSTQSIQNCSSRHLQCPTSP